MKNLVLKTNLFKVLVDLGVSSLLGSLTTKFF